MLIIYYKCLKRKESKEKMSNSVKLAKNVSVNDLEYEGPMKNSYGGKFARVKSGGRWLLVQSPKMSSPFGVNKWENQNASGSTTASYSIEVSFNGYEEDDNGEPRDHKVREFYDKVREMEDHLIDHATDNSYEWFEQEDVERGTAKTLLRSCVRFSKDKATGRESKKYAPRMKFNIPVYDGQLSTNCHVFDSDNQELKTIEEIQAYASGKCQVVVISRCDKVTFNGAKYGYKWMVQQMKIIPSSNGLNNYAFIDEDGSSSQSSSQSSSTVNIVDDEDDVELEEEVSDDVDELDQEESDDEEPIPPPKKKKVVKKRGRKKKNDN
jgi:hypothetical protein